jgi:hypothetical protein
VGAEECHTNIETDALIVSSSIRIPNLSRPEHAESHRNLISDYGGSVSASSIVYDSDGFVIRMWSNDHGVPHFHVLLGRDTSKTQAKIRIGTLDILEGELSPVLSRKVRRWAGDHHRDLLRNWARCRTGEHPFRLED